MLLRRFRPPATVGGYSSVRHASRLREPSRSSKNLPWNTPARNARGSLLPQQGRKVTASRPASQGRDGKPDPEPQPQPQQPQSSLAALSEGLRTTDPSTNTLLAPVHIPSSPSNVLKDTHPSASILANSGLVVQRQIEMLNVFMGFEQANRYVILDAQGNHVGYLAEHDGGLGSAMKRQLMRTHRGFVANVFDRSGREVLRVRTEDHSQVLQG